MPTKGKKDKKDYTKVKLNNAGEIDHSDNYIYKLHTRPKPDSPSREKSPELNDKAQEPSEKLSMVALQKKIKEDLKQIVDDVGIRNQVVKEAEEVRK